jgi:hypothetical protein
VTKVKNAIVFPVVKRCYENLQSSYRPIRFGSSSRKKENAVRVESECFLTKRHKESQWPLFKKGIGQPPPERLTLASISEEQSQGDQKTAEIIKELL